MSCPQNFPGLRNKPLLKSWLVKILIGLVVFAVLLGCNLASAIQENANQGTPEPTPSDGTGGDETAVPDNPDPNTPDGDTTTPTPETLGDMNLERQTSAAVPTSGGMKDETTGIEIEMPPDVMAEAETQLNQFAISPNWESALGEDYEIESPFVSLTTTGLNDSQGRARVRLPAPSPESQLVALIDESYLTVVKVTPMDGYLETAVRIGSPEDSGQEQVGSMAPGGKLHFAVLTPKTGRSSLDRFGLGKPAGQGDGRSCGVEVTYYGGSVTLCRQNESGTVQVSFRDNIGFSQSEGDQIADAVAAAMNRYSDLGFTAANLTAWSPMRVVVSAGSGDPSYRSGNGVIYLPLDVARNMAGGTDHAVLHEMAHWIEDEAYNMAWAFWSGGTWWMETAAENMVMLQDPAYIPQNLETYGAISTSDNRLALQQSPYQWPTDFYAHAQLVKLNMCDDTAVCPLSQTTFVAAINAGTYPYDDAGAKAKLSSNLDAYAQYLLGVSPPSANTAMPVTGPVASGDRYGEYVNIAKTNNNDYRLGFNGYAPQMVQTSDDRGTGVNIQATLQKDGVYPLIVSSGVADGRNPGLPVALTIQPGAPFWYRVGNDAPIFHDGREELVLQPIHSTLGITAVRVAAMGKEGGEVFTAQVRPIDLQGAWMMTPGAVVSSDVQCVDDEGQVSEDFEQESFPLMITLGSALGHFRPDAAGMGGLTWTWDESKRVPEIAESNITFQGAALLGTEDVKVQAALHLPKASSQAPSVWPPVVLAMVGFGPGIAWWRNGRRRPYLTILSLAVLGILLVGCISGISLWGDVSADMQFTELEYIGGEGVPTFGGSTETEIDPLWKAQGTGEYDVDFSAEISVDTGDGEESSVVRCTGTAVFEVETLIFKDVILDLGE